jgi:DNA primase catalytic core
MAEVVASIVKLDRLPNGNGPVMAVCPFHDDHTPSLAIYADHAYCFGACQKSWDVFGWVMQRDGLPFAEALDCLARERGISRPQWTPEEEDRARQHQSERELLQVAVDYYGGRLWAPGGQRALNYARGRGLADTTIREYHLGLADGSLRAHLRAMGADLDMAQRIGLLREEGGDHFFNRLVFPFMHLGRANYFIGRSLAPDGHPKYLNPPGQKQVFRNTHAQHSHGQPILLVESVLDAIALGQHGFAAIALNGTALQEQDVAEIKRYTTVYMMLDADDAGHAGNAKTANALGPLTRVARLPDGSDDPAAWLQAGASADDVRTLMNAAPTWLEVEMAEAAALTGADRIGAMQNLFATLVHLDNFALAHYQPLVNRALKLTVSESNKLLKAVKQASSALAPADSEPHVLDTSKYPLLAPALDFGQKLGLTTIGAYALVENKAVNLPYVITSDRHIVRVGEAGLLKLGEHSVILTDAPAAGMTRGWSWVDAQRFVSGDTPNAVETLTTLVEAYETLVDFPEPDTAVIVALWAMATYLHPLFAAFPFLALSGPAGSGKTKVGEITTRVAFNGRASANISPAALYRVVQVTHCSLFIDEAERLSNSKDPTSTELRLLLNASYKKGTPVTRFNADLGEVEEFYPYGPKLLASVRELDAADTLGSRCIRIAMLRTTSGKGNLVVTDDSVDFTAIRHELNCFALLHFQAIREIYDEDTTITILNNRQMELWRPLLSLAKYLTDLPGGPDDFLEIVMRYARTKSSQDGATGFPERERALLLALYELVGAKASAELKAKDIKDKMLDHLGEYMADDITEQWIGYAIKRLGLLPDASRKKRSRDGARYQVFSREVSDIMERYGVNNEDEPETAKAITPVIAVTERCIEPDSS